MLDHDPSWPNQGLPWIEAEIEFLKTHFATMPYAELTRRLGRGDKSVQAKANSLGLFRRKDKWKMEKPIKPKRERDLELVKAILSQPKLSNRQLAKQLNTTPGVVAGTRHAAKYGHFDDHL